MLRFTTTFLLLSAVWFSTGQILRLKQHDPLQHHRQRWSGSDYYDENNMGTNGAGVGAGGDDDDDDDDNDNDVDDEEMMAAAATVNLQVPKSVEVVVKDFNRHSETGPWYVDRVHAVKYINKRIGTRDYSQLDSGVIDLHVTVNYCNCEELARGGGGGRRIRSNVIEFDYQLYFYIVNGYIYFSTSVFGERVENDGRGYKRIPEDLLNRWDLYRRNFGPFKKRATLVGNRGNGTETSGSPAEFWVKILDENAIKEWVAFEMSSELFKRYVWNRPDNGGERRTAENDKDRVTFSAPGYYRQDALDDGGECRDLDEKRAVPVPSDSIVVHRGGCVKAYGGKRCAGSARFIFQEHVRLFSQHNDVVAGLPDVKSVSACWSRDLMAAAEHRAAAAAAVSYYDNHDKRIQCSCSPLSSRTSVAEDARPDTAKRDYAQPAGTDITPAGIAWILGTLTELNATATAATTVTLEKCVAVMTADTPAAMDAAAAAETAAARTVVRSATHAMRLLHILSGVPTSSPSPQPQPQPYRSPDFEHQLGLRLLTESTEDTEESVAVTVVPENVTYAALNLALSTTCTQAFLSSAVKTAVSDFRRLPMTSWPITDDNPMVAHWRRGDGVTVDRHHGRRRRRRGVAPAKKTGDPSSNVFFVIRAAEKDDENEIRPVENNMGTAIIRNNTFFYIQVLRPKKVSD